MQPHPVTVTFWSHGAAERHGAALRRRQSRPRDLAFSPGSRYHAGRLRAPAAGTLVLDIWSPRPLRLWLDGAPVLDEPLFWRFYERQLRAAVVVPCPKGDVPFLVEIGERSTWGDHIDRDCPSRRREFVRSELRRRLPDRLGLSGRILAGVEAPAVSLRFLPAQFRRDGVAWQQVTARLIPGYPAQAPSIGAHSALDEAVEPLALVSSVQPGEAIDATTAEERQRGIRRFYVPVSHAGDAPAALRRVGQADARVEPSIEVARMLALSVEGRRGSANLEMPGYESLGRQAPQREFRALAWPAFAEARARLPEPVLPDGLARFGKLYWAAWEMLYGLVRHPAAESGLPNAYIGTASRNFLLHQFVWDSSFTAMATAYGWRALHPHATLDVLYSRQFDGGYIHREHDVRDGVPAAYEPDFSPNPPVMSVAEWAIAGLTGNRLRLAQVYPALRDNHRWLRANRRLPDGTYWTTGLANGLDNSPSLGDGYPCLTAQMAHDAEMLARIARVLGHEAEARRWEAEQRAIGRALNARLWSESMQIYSTSLAGGGHNPNKVVTAFWPLWAGVVPRARVEALARHLKDPRSFWRHHPIPSLAADSPHFKPGGDYWLGSTWAPTNFAAIQGFARVGRRDLARETVLRHLDGMLDVLNATGHIWENYCSEESARGSWSGPDYCWSSAGPIALLFEIVLGIRGDALNRRVVWTLPDEPVCGVRNLALGPATVSLRATVEADSARRVEVETDRAFTLELCAGGPPHVEEFRAGRRALRVPAR